MERDTAAAARLAARLLERRDLPSVRVRQRLEAAGVAAAAAEAILAELEAAGYVDDRRLAALRAVRLAERGYGDAVIAGRLEGEGLSRETVAAALGALEPEPERARRFAAAAGGREAARILGTLRRRGFAEDALEAAMAALDGAPGSELR